jgi:cytidylate kinase
MSHYIVAIDGVSGSGKSSTAKAVAKELGILHLDTGAMYRAITFMALRSGVSPENAEALAALSSHVDIDLDPQGRLRIDGMDLSKDIRSPEVNAAVSDYARVPEVRKVLVEIQRRIGSRRSLVAEGRDMGSVVFPEARFKFFMWASPEVRATRRVIELEALGLPADYDEVLKNLADRDVKDSGRTHSPLVKAPDAIEIDTSRLTFPEQVAIITSHVLKHRPS